MALIGAIEGFICAASMLMGLGEIPLVRSPGLMVSVVLAALIQGKRIFEAVYAHWAQKGGVLKPPLLATVSALASFLATITPVISLKLMSEWHNVWLGVVCAATVVASVVLTMLVAKPGFWSFARKLVVLWLILAGAFGVGKLINLCYVLFH